MHRHVLLHGGSLALRIGGCITALVTPFNERLGVDYEGLRRNVRFQIENGISGLAPLGTTGEAPTIRDDERKGIINTVIEEAAGKVPVIVGAGTHSTEHTIAYAQEAEDLGADALLVVSPYYNKPSQEGLYRHFEAISKSVGISIIPYNIPGRTAVNIEPGTMSRIASLPNVIGVKEASGNIAQITEVISRAGEGFSVLSGDDCMTIPIMSLGGTGVISVASNLLPRRVAEMTRAASAGDWDLAARLNLDMLPIFRGAFLETNPVPIKTAMRICGMPAGGVRLPLYGMGEANIRTLRGILLGYGELEIVDRRVERIS